MSVHIEEVNKAIEILKSLCSECHSCQECPVYGRCGVIPKYWEMIDDEVDDMQNDEYIPLCPFGATDCVCDPAYIHYAHPEWYRSMHGDKTPEEVVNETCARKNRFPHCYDDEDE